MIVAAVLAAAVLLALVAWLLTRHRHRWSPWSARVVTRDGGQVLQLRTCKDPACRLQQIKDITP